MKKYLSLSGGGGGQEVQLEQDARSHFPSSSAPGVLSRISQAGFTLPELLIVIGLVGVIIGIAIPGFRDYSNKSNLETSLDKITRTLSLARNRSLTTYPNSQIVVCPSSNTDSNTPSCDNAAATDYSAGWLVFTDCNGNDTYESAGLLCDTDGDATAVTTDGDDVTETLLLIQPALRGIAELPADRDTVGVKLESVTNDRVEFSRTGQANSSLTFDVKKDGNTYANISMNAIGRFIVSVDKDFFR